MMSCKLALFVYQLLIRSGRTPDEAIMILVPEAYKNHPTLSIKYPEVFFVDMLFSLCCCMILILEKILFSTFLFWCYAVQVRSDLISYKDLQFDSGAVEFSQLMTKLNESFFSIGFMFFSCYHCLNPLSLCFILMILANLISLCFLTYGQVWLVLFHRL